MDGELPPLGHIVSINGAKVTGVYNPMVHTDRASVLRKCGRAGEAEFGTLVKVRTRASWVFGMVTAQWIPDVTADLDMAQQMLTVELLGEMLTLSRDPGAGVFRRGVSVYPTLGADICLATRDDLARIYAKPETASVPVGTVAGDPTLAAYLAVDGLLGKHFAVLGTTGSGKSCAVAMILRAILCQHTNGHVIVLDPHNEYAAAFGPLAEVISPANLQLPYWLMNFDELAGALVSSEGASRSTELTILKQAVLDARRAFAGDEDEAAHITVDTPVPFRLGELEQLVRTQMGRLNRADTALPYQRLLARMETLRADRRFEFLFSGLIVRDTMSDVLSRILRVPAHGRPVTVIDLSGVPSEIVDVVVSLMSRMVFDFALWSVEPQALPVLIVCEEAHRYVGGDDGAGFTLSRNALSRIAKEGRKYGVSLCLVSQRPAELSATILSQCNTIFALRLSNDFDQQFVRRALPDSASGLLGALPALHTREAIAVGEGVPVPMRLRFAELEPGNRPRSGTARFSLAWNGDRPDRGFVEATIERWRHQVREPVAAAPLGQ
jgi:DNA helicase HerA-like ATPase